MNPDKEVKLYGSPSCHKTKYYKDLLEELELPFIFMDVINDHQNAKELRGLYNNGKLNFPTITIGEKKLRNPSEKTLIHWLNILIPNRLTVEHDKANSRFTMAINKDLALVEYQFTKGKMYLLHSEVPLQLRGRGIGLVLVTKTFERLTAEGYKAVAVCAFIKAIARRSEKWNKVIQ